MQTIYVPKYKLHYRVNPKDSTELQWSKKPFGPGTQWQHAMSFSKPIRALDMDDKTGQGVVVLNDSSTYVGSGVRQWGRKFYPAGTRIFSLYAIGESKEKQTMKKCSMQKKMESLNYGNKFEKIVARNNLKPIEAYISQRIKDFRFKDIEDLRKELHAILANSGFTIAYGDLGDNLNYMELSNSIDVGHADIWDVDPDEATIYGYPTNTCKIAAFPVSPEEYNDHIMFIIEVPLKANNNFIALGVYVDEGD